MDRSDRPCEFVRCFWDYFFLVHLFYPFSCSRTIVWFSRLHNPVRCIVLSSGTLPHAVALHLTRQAAYAARYTSIRCVWSRAPLSDGSRASRPGERVAVGFYWHARDILSTRALMISVKLVWTESTHRPHSNRTALNCTAQHSTV